MGRARRRMQVFEDEEPPLLDGIPVIQESGKRKSPAAPMAPPPTEVSPETLDVRSGETSVGGGAIEAVVLFLLPDPWVTGIPFRNGSISSSKTCILLQARPTR